MFQPITGFNPEYTVKNRKYKAVRDNNEQIPLFSKLKEDIDRLETKANQQTLLNILSPIPTARRLQSLPDTVEENNYSRAGLLFGLAAANIPGDLREVGVALKNGLQKNPYQYEMSFFKGTLLNKLSTKYEWLNKADKTLFDTKFGTLIKNRFNLGVDMTDIGTIENIAGKEMYGFKYTGNFLQKTLGRAMHRIPVIGLIASTALEIPALGKSITETKGSAIDKAKAFGKQLIKSTGYIGFTTAGISIAGAILFPHCALLGLVGMAIGSTAGLMASKELNKIVDTI